MVATNPTVFFSSYACLRHCRKELTVVKIGMDDFGSSVEDIARRPSPGIAQLERFSAVADLWCHDKANMYVALNYTESFVQLLEPTSS